MQTSISEHLDPSKLLGLVTQVGQHQLMMRMVAGGSRPETHKGDAAVGEYVLVTSSAGDSKVLLGQITEVVADRRATDGMNLLASEASVKLLTTVDFDSGKITPGILTSPGVGSEVFAAGGELVLSVLESHDRIANFDKARANVELNLANLVDSDETSLSLTPESLFGRHMAIVGTTGAGKSWSVAKLAEECSKHKAKVILLDATGEYSTLSNNTYHVYIGNDPDPDPGTREVVIPYHQLYESDLFAIFKPSGQSQGPKLRAAMKTLKVCSQDSSLSLDGKMIKVHKQKNKFLAAQRKHQAFVDSPHATFDIGDLAEQVINECVYPSRSELEPHFWGGINGADQGQCIPLVNRIQDISSSPNLSPIFDPGDKPSLLTAIEAFLVDDSYSVLRVSLQYLSFDHNAREIIVNALGRHLLQLARDSRFRESPLLIIVDEAHQFLNKYLTDADQQYPLDSFALIAKEGRKYAINICLATQRPRDIPEDVLSQMGSMMIHRLINHHDRDVVEKASQEMDESAVKTVPTLASGEAVLIGVDFPVPTHIRVTPPKTPPISSGPDYQKFWRMS